MASKIGLFSSCLLLRACGKFFNDSSRRGSSLLARAALGYTAQDIHQKSSSRSLNLYIGINSFAPPLKQRCEDAYFAYETERSVIIGIADGVSSWKKEGIDPSLFSNALMANCLKIAQKSHSDSILCPSMLLEESYQHIQDNKEVPGGSSTACLLVFDKLSGWTKTSNLGDSGYRVYRNGVVFNSSQEQYHHDVAPFYAPYQLAVMPNDDAKYKKYFTNRPRDADVQSFYLKSGDVIVLGTDGLFDNMWNDEILDFFPSSIDQMCDTHLSHLAENLAWEAQERAQDVSSDRITPYCKKLYGESDMLVSACGGNIDDVTVAIAVIRP